jgi:hypothetical protein
MKPEYEVLLSKINKFLKLNDSHYSFEINNEGLFPFCGFNEFLENSLKSKKINNINNYYLLRTIVNDAKHLDYNQFLIRNLNQNFKNIKNINIQNFLVKFNKKSFKTSTNLIFDQWKKYIEKYNIEDKYSDEFIRIQDIAIENLSSISKDLLKLNFILNDIIYDKLLEKDSNEVFLRTLYNSLKEFNDLDIIINYENSNSYISFNNCLKQMNDLTIKIREDLKLKKISNFISISDEYISLKNKVTPENQTELTSLMLNKFEQDVIDLKINLSKSQKFEEIIFFHNKQFILKDSKGNYIEPKNTQEAKNLLKEFSESLISFELKKHPNIAKFVINLFKEEINIVGAFILIDAIKENHQILKNNNFQFDNELSIEGLTDEIFKTVQDHKVKQLAFSILSNKYKHLYSDECKPFFENMFNSNFTSNQVQEILGKKIASCKTKEDFFKHVESVHDKIFKFSKEKLLADLSKSKDVQVISEQDDVVVLKINNFEDSKILGTSNWCISREYYYFEDYAQNNNQYFIYDFNNDTPENLSLIGVTLFKNGNLKAAHDKNDYSLKHDSIIDDLSCLIIENDLKNFPDISEESRYSHLIKQKNKQKFNIG